MARGRAGHGDRSQLRAIGSWIAALATALAAALCACSPAQAAEVTYTLTATNGANWSSGAWLGGDVPPATPAPGDTTRVRVFNGSSPHTAITTNMDIAGLTIDRLDFQGLDIKVAGSTPLTLRGNAAFTSTVIMNPFVGNELALPITATGRGFVDSTAAGFLKLSGTTTVAAGATLAFTGNATTGTTVTGTLAGAGTKIVGSGVLQLDNSGFDTAITAGEVGAGAGLPGAAPILRLAQSREIGNGVRVFANPGGTFDLNGKFDDIGSLAIIDGSVTIGGGDLEVAGATQMTGGSITGTAPAALTLGGDLTAGSSQAVGATISAPVKLSGARTFQVLDGAAAEDLVVSGVVSQEAAGAALTKAGAGTLALTPPSSNLYSGGTTVTHGTLVTGATSGRAIPVNGTITVGDGTGAASSAVLRFGLNNDIDLTTTVAVRPDGQVDLNGHPQTIAGLSVEGGRVELPAASVLTVAGSVGMSGGTIAGAGTARLNAVAVTAGGGPARLLPGTLIPLAGTSDGIAFAVAAGTAPELEVAGLSQGAATAATLKKSGAGTLLVTGTNALPGGADVQAGTLTMNGAQTTPVTVGAAGRLSGTGSVGATTVAGVLAPGSPSLSTADLTFTPSGSLAIAGPPSAALPRVEVTGTATIQPGAQLSSALTADPVAPAGTQLPLIANDAGEGVTGRFANAPEGFGLTGASGQGFTLGYLLGDGNDVAFTAAPAPPTTPTTPTTPAAPDTSTPPAEVPPAARKPVDRTGPKVAVTVPRSQKLSRTGTFAAKLACDEACTITLTVSLKPPGRKAAVKATKTLRLKARANATTVIVAVPRSGLAAVRRALRARRSVPVILSASARDAAGNKSLTRTGKTTLKG
jgi:autotransporter-associated beta strand protein